MTKLNWVLTLVVVVLVEYVIMSWIHEYGARPDVVSYVSFAGTIVSIILAVLAIVYSYYQGFSQQRDSGNISAQVDLLRAVVGDIKRAERALSGGMKNLTDFGSKIDRSVSLTEETRSSFREMLARLDEIGTRAVGEPEGGGNGSPAQRKPVAGAAESLVATAISEQLAIYIAHIEGAKRGLLPSEINSEILLPAVAAQGGSDLLQMWASGVSAGHRWVLADLGLLTYDQGDGERRFKVNSHFEGLVRRKSGTIQDGGSVLSLKAVQSQVEKQTGS